MKSVRRAVNRIGEELFPLYLKVQKADMLAQSEYRRDEKIARQESVKACYEEMLKQNQCVSLKTLAVTGRDLIQAGYKPGPELGEILNRLLEHVLDVPEDNDKRKINVTFDILKAVAAHDSEGLPQAFCSGILFCISS